jgi:hypothetical protein
MSKTDFDRTRKVNVDDIVKTIPVVCSWCNKIYHIKQWSIAAGDRTGITHGMCSECEKKQKAELEKFLKENNNSIKQK